jgi:hypothetical protein
MLPTPAQEPVSASALVPPGALTGGASGVPVVSRCGKARFTPLTSAVVRMEWSPSGAFEDRATLTFIQRDRGAWGCFSFVLLPPRLPHPPSPLCMDGSSVAKQRQLHCDVDVRRDGWPGAGMVPFSRCRCACVVRLRVKMLVVMGGERVGGCHGRRWWWGLGVGGGTRPSKQHFRTWERT